MERLLTVVFENEAKAYEGLRALNQLSDEGSITAYAAQVIQKDANGKISAKQTEGAFPLQTAKGLWIGSLIGLLGGPVGMVVGGAVAGSAGAIGDLNIAGLNADFIDDVSRSLTPGKVAVVADVNEDWVTPVDTRMEALGGSVFRTVRRQFEADERSREVSELKSEIADLKAEQAQARADDKAKLQAKVEKLNAKLQQKVANAKKRSEQIQNETNARVQALQQQAASARGEAKAKIEARIAKMRDDYDKSAAKLNTLAA